MAKKAKKRPPKQLRFVEEYPVDLDGTAAAIRADFSPKTAAVKASQLLKIPWIRKAVNKKIDARSKNTGITADNVLKEIAKSGFSNIQDIFTEDGELKNIMSLPKEVAAAIASIKVVTRTIPGSDPVVVEYVSEIKMVDKKGSLQDLGKHFKMFTDVVDLNVDLKPMNVNISFKD